MDEQHKRLFEVINELGDFLNDDHGSDNQKWNIQTFIIEILNYVEKHFRDEERLMEQTNAHWLEEHKKIHQGLAADVIDFRDKIVKLSDDEERLHMLEQIHKFMANWLIRHIMMEDVKFGDYFKQQAAK